MSEETPVTNLSGNEQGNIGSVLLAIAFHVVYLSFHGC